MTNVTRVAAVQLCSEVDPAGNIAAISELVRAAAKAGARYVLTPEVSVAFARNRDEMAEVAVPFEGNPAIAELGALAAELGVHLHLGSLAVTLESGKFANRSVLFTPEGAIAATYDKIHLFDADPPGDRPYRESDSYDPGAQVIVSEAPGFGLGFSICYDVRFGPLYTALADAGAEVIAVPAAFTVPTGAAHWEVLVRARAIETGCFVIAAAQGGSHANGRHTFGHSMIVDPWGHVIAAKGDDTPGIITADLDLSRVADARARLPVLANRRQFSLSVNHKL